MAHFSGTPSSLPQDYTHGHFAGEHDIRRHLDEGDEVLPNLEDEQLSSSDSVSSMTKDLVISSTVNSVEFDSADSYLPSETTPLLSPPVPRIVKNVDFTSCGSIKPVSMFWEEVVTLFKYTLPVFCTHIFEHSIIITSVISIGHISTTALAAATIGFMTANVTGLSVIQGMSSALDTVLPSAWTSQPQLVGLWTQRMTVLQLLVLIPISAIWLNGENLLLLLRQDPEVAKFAGIYLKWALFCLPAYSFNCISRRYFQSQGLFTVPARIIIFVAPINILLNYLFVWGPDPVRLGFIGAPIATSISYNLISIASIIYGLFFVEKTAWHPISTRCFTSLGLLAKLSVGSVGQVASEWWSWELVALAASFLGPTNLATQSVLLSTSSCIYQASYSLGIATSVRIGNLLGEKNAKRAGVTANAALLLSVALGLFLSGLLLTFRKTWGYMFNSDPEVVPLVAALLPLLALIQVCDDSVAVIAGILRARGKQTLGALVNISAYYCLGFPIGLWLTFKQDFGLSGLWWGLNIAMTWTASIGLYLCMSTDWQREVDKATARLEVDLNANQRQWADEENAH
ncbi:MATE efflux family protein [Melanogaster broomeanus]|nr:MATE efflux family protein [Melanogaster broomeanus]